MSRELRLLVTVLAVLALSATAVFAAKPGGAGSGSPHLVGSLTTVLDGNSFTITGKIAGLGSGWNGATANGTATVTADITCTSPGGNVAPGQQGKVFSASVTGTVGGPEQNGQYTFEVSGEVPVTPARSLGCPNNNWTASANITSVVLTSLSLTHPTTGEVVAVTL